jgi:hypothetical protein
MRSWTVFVPTALFLQLLASAVPADDAYIKADGNKWTLGTATIEQVVALEDGRFLLKSFKNKTTNRELVPGGTVSDEFFVRLGDAKQPLTGATGPWKLVHLNHPRRAGSGCIGSLREARSRLGRQFSVGYIGFRRLEHGELEPGVGFRFGIWCLPSSLGGGVDVEARTGLTLVTAVHVSCRNGHPCNEAGLLEELKSFRSNLFVRHGVSLVGHFLVYVKGRCLAADAGYSGRERFYAEVGGTP